MIKVRWKYKVLHLLLLLLVQSLQKFADHVRVRSSSQLIKSISSVLQNLRQYFNGIYRLFGTFIVQMWLLYFMFPCCNIAINFQIFLNNYRYILLNYILALQQIFRIIYLCAIYFSYAVNNWCLIFKYCLFISSICSS